MSKEEKKQITAIEVLDRLYDSGELHQLLDAGLISVNVIVWRKIYHAYNLRLSQGVNSLQAVSDTADVFRISDRSVYRTIERLKK